MFQVGGWEFLVILVVALIVLGPERLPGVARQVGQTIGTMRQMAQSFQTEFEQAVDAAETAARLEEDESGAAETSSEGPTDGELIEPVEPVEPVETEVSADQGRSPDAPVDQAVADTNDESPSNDESEGDGVASDSFAGATRSSAAGLNVDDVESGQKPNAADDVIETARVVETSPEELPGLPERSPAAADVASLEPNRVEKPKSGEVPPTAEPGAA